MIKSIIAGFIALLFVPLAWGEIAAPSAPTLAPSGLFTDSMVLQRDAAAPVWGTAKPGETVTVSFAGQTKTAQADANGQWLVKLDALPASNEPRELTIRDARETRVFKDVVVGDVWLCSGQSNMAFRMVEAEKSKEEIAAARNPAVRFYRVAEKFALQPVTEVKGEWKQISPETAAECSAVAYYFAQAVQPKLGVPIGLLVSSIGGTRIETWSSPATLARLGVADRLLEKWKDVSAGEFERILAEYRAYQHQLYRVHPDAVRTAKAKGEPAPPEPKRPAMRGHDSPGALHHGMIAPLQPYAIRGALWYQGEANVSAPGAYPKLQSALVADWRKIWGDKLPFLFVQLAPHKTATPGFREAQFDAWQSTPQTAMVVTTDVGDAENIHPTRKRPVGERLALAARALAYGQPVVYSGPVFDRLKIEDRRAVITFRHARAGLMAKDGPLKGFTVAGADGKFVAATAVIQDATVVVTAEGVANPVAVRYGWASVPDVNLYNREGLPAVPFRTDD
jgi:sialate O-acetylesterase